MKDFSNETKTARINAVLKVILKRYSFIVWLPLLLWLSYNIGKIHYPEAQNSIITIIAAISWGIVVLIMFLMLVLLIFEVIIIPIIEKTFLSDLIAFFKLIGGFLLAIMKAVPIIILEILKSPIYLYKRIKDEKRRFQNAVEKQISKDSNKNLGGDIEN